eukprot:6676182-Ditylum_brightwellii.AAC.1
MSSVQAKNTRDDAANYCASKGFSTLYEGAMYITLEAAMAYQRESRDRSISISSGNTNMDSDDEHQGVT